MDEAQLMEMIDSLKTINTHNSNTSVQMTSPANKLTLAVDELTSAIKTFIGAAARIERSQENEAG